MTSSDFFVALRKRHVSDCIRYLAECTGTNRLTLDALSRVSGFSVDTIREAFPDDCDLDTLTVTKANSRA